MHHGRFSQKQPITRDLQQIIAMTEAGTAPASTAWKGTPGQSSHTDFIAHTNKMELKRITTHQRGLRREDNTGPPTPS
ncbi:hypothetical protein Nepgr_033904 [Nepenthes gracilis]|uniref:Uncharacterized protein n=1 Tax=Nepenthes gracilis TaxID=150966 RepID=A0AAD3TL92_NEPGR|nr:hypothetical protein Nepgr_033904 [Nepenthes gracilis]